jgi:hypothetical protein
VPQQIILLAGERMHRLNDIKPLFQRARHPAL